MHPRLKFAYFHRRVVPSFLSRAGQTRPTRLLHHAFLFFSLSLPFSPFSHFTHPQPDGVQTEMESQAQPVTASSKTSLLDAKPSNGFPSGVMSHQPTCLPRSICIWNQLHVTIQQRERQWQTAYRRSPTPLETQEKNDRDRSTLITGNSLRVHSFRRSITGKI